MRPAKPSSLSRSSFNHIGKRRNSDVRSQLYRALSTHAGLLAAFCAVIVLSVVYYVAIRDHSVELSFDQLSAFERQVQTVGNHSVYVVEAGQQDDVLSSLAREDWAHVSSRIDYVAFVYGDVSAVMDSDSWVRKVSGALEDMKPRGYGVVLFACGCVFPNIIFTDTKTRFQGYECAMLPGFVMGKDAVRFVNVSVVEEKCRNRDKILGGPWYKDNSWKLEDAQAEHEALRKHLAASGT